MIFLRINSHNFSCSMLDTTPTPYPKKFLVGFARFTWMIPGGSGRSGPLDPPPPGHLRHWLRCVDSKLGCYSSWQPQQLTRLCRFKPPPPVGAGEGYMFSGRPSVRASVLDSRGSFMFPQYLQCLLTDFRQTFVTGASRDRDDLITFWGQKVKVQGHAIPAEAHSTRRYRRVQLFLV